MTNLNTHEAALIKDTLSEKKDVAPKLSLVVDNTRNDVVDITNDSIKGIKRIIRGLSKADLTELKKEAPRTNREAAEELLGEMTIADINEAKSIGDRLAAANDENFNAANIKVASRAPVKSLNDTLVASGLDKISA